MPVLTVTHDGTTQLSGRISSDFFTTCRTLN